MPRNLLFALLGSLATVAVGWTFMPLMSREPAELPTAWHDVAEVPDDDREFTNWWNDLGNRAKRETLKHPREPLWFACQLKTQPRAD